MEEFKFDKSLFSFKSWIPYSKIEESALDQIRNITSLPFLYKHLAIMPDVHAGCGVTIGSVLACKDVIIPNAVGVDIGCGIAAVKTSLKDISVENLKDIMSLIRKSIPVGFLHHSRPQDESIMPELNDQHTVDGFCDTPICEKEYRSALTQLGTLGGGNHFIEIQRGDDGYIWFMVHSGSRNLGYKVAKHYDEIAIELNKKWYTSVPKEYDLAYLPVDSDEGKLYLNEMRYCLNFAQANRDTMVERIKEAFYKVTSGISFDTTINIHHNYATLERHMGRDVWVHRKGATSAKDGEIGIIPGSQGTASYIVRGKGNISSFMSCSHGAGRTMSRTRAIKELDLVEEQRRLNEQGILHSVRDKNALDEAPSAYKDIEEVMENQKDLVDITIKLKPLAVIKG